jgi:hypothetical protein
MYQLENLTRERIYSESRLNPSLTELLAYVAINNLAEQVPPRFQKKEWQLRLRLLLAFALSDENFLVLGEKENLEARSYFEIVISTLYILGVRYSQTGENKIPPHPNTDRDKKWRVANLSYLGWSVKEICAEVDIDAKELNRIAYNLAYYGITAPTVDGLPLDGKGRNKQLYDFLSRRDFTPEQLCKFYEENPDVDYAYVKHEQRKPKRDQNLIGLTTLLPELNSHKKNLAYYQGILSRAGIVLLATQRPNSENITGISKSLYVHRIQRDEAISILKRFLKKQP